MKDRIGEIRERVEKAEEWSQNCGNRPGEWSEGMYPQNFLARDLYALLSRIEALERVREALEAGREVVRDLGRKIASASSANPEPVLMVDASDLANRILQFEKTATTILGGCEDGK